MSNLKNIQEQKDFYNAYWQGLQPIGRYKLTRANWITDVLLHLKKQHKGGQMNLLDLGCGDGRLAPLWQAVTGAIAYGLELSPKAVAVANQMFPSIQYTEGDATNTPYIDGMFDVIVCQEVLEHIEQQEKLIAECSRILTPNGTLILTTPNKYYFDHRKGGNYSQQPIENIIDKAQLYQLLKPHFEVQSYETLVYARGDHGIYKLLTNKYLLSILRRLGLENAWKSYLLKKGYGLHMAVVCKKL